MSAGITKLNKLKATLKLLKDNLGKGLKGTKAQRKAEKEAQQKAIETAKLRIKKQKEIVAKEKAAVEKKPSARDAADGDIKETKSTANPKVEADKAAKKQLTEQRVKRPAEKQAARDDADSPMIQQLQNEVDIRTGGNKPPAFFSDGPTKAELGAAAYRKTSDFTAQQVKKQQANYERLYTKLQNPDLSPAEKRGLRKSINNVEKQIGKENLNMDFKSSVKPPKPKAKKEPKQKPFTGSLRGAYNQAKKDGSASFTFDGKKMNTEAVAKRFAAAEEKAGLSRGGMPRKRMGSTDYRKGGMVKSSYNLKRGR